MWHLAGVQLESRLLLGTAQYPSPQILADAVKASGTQVVTASLRRQNPSEAGGQTFWDMLKALGVQVLPNTAGCRNVREAVTTAQMAREIFDTPWIKLEVIGDDYTLQPDPFALLEAAKELLKQGFEVFPYCTDDLILCRRLADAGCKVVMPWASPIGSGQGLLNPYNLKVIREKLPDITLIIDAGIGKPSDAVQALEFGYDGVLLNSAVALAGDPVGMATAFKHAITAGRLGFEAKTMAKRDFAHASTPDAGKPFWHHKQ